ncbi:MAG: MBL fold metallo-hydrolase [Nanobdellota archaeon]
MIENIEWLGHASFRIFSDQLIYVDPWKVNPQEKADIILITHPHHDHCSPEDVKKILKENTVIVTVADAAEKLQDISAEISVIEPGKKIDIDGVDIRAIHAYNRKLDYHPRKNGWVGFLIDMLGDRIYFAGDTDHIKEMKDLEDVSIAVLPIGGTYTMGVGQAVEAALDIQPKQVIPMHYGDIVGGESFAEDFRAALRERDPSIEVYIKGAD